MYREKSYYSSAKKEVLAHVGKSLGQKAKELPKDIFLNANWNLQRFAQRIERFLFGNVFDKEEVRISPKNKQPNKVEVPKKRFELVQRISQKTRPILDLIEFLFVTLSPLNYEYKKTISFISRNGSKIKKFFQKILHKRPKKRKIIKMLKIRKKRKSYEEIKLLHSEKLAITSYINRPLFTTLLKFITFLYGAKPRWNGWAKLDNDIRVDGAWEKLNKTHDLTNIIAFLEAHDHLEKPPVKSVSFNKKIAKEKAEQGE